jgi:hypothetical protein
LNTQKHLHRIINAQEHDIKENFSQMPAISRRHIKKNVKKKGTDIEQIGN